MTQSNEDAAGAWSDFCQENGFSNEVFNATCPDCGCVIALMAESGTTAETMGQRARATRFPCPKCKSTAWVEEEGT